MRQIPGRTVSLMASICRGSRRPRHWPKRRGAKLSRLPKGLRENPDLLEKAGVDGRPVGRLALRSVISVASHQSNARLPALVPALFAGQREVVAMDHRGAAGEAQDRQDIGGGAAPDLLGVVGVVSDETAADLGAFGSAQDDGVAATEGALDLDHARRQQAGVV